MADTAHTSQLHERLFGLLTGGGQLTLKALLEIV